MLGCVSLVAMNIRVLTFQLLNFLMCAPYSGAFFRADERGIVCFPKNVRINPPNVIKILELLWGPKNKVVTFLSIWGQEDAP